MATLDSTGAASKARIKEGDQLIPKTTFKPIAAPGKLHGLKVKSTTPPPPPMIRTSLGWHRQVLHRDRRSTRARGRREGQ